MRLWSGCAARRAKGQFATSSRSHRQAATMLGRPEPEWAPAGTSRHVWPKLCIAFHTLLVKLCNSLPQDPGSLLVGGHQVIHRTGKMTNPWAKKGLNTDFLHGPQQICTRTRRILKVCFLTRKAHQRGSNLPQGSPSLGWHYKDEILVKSSGFKT